MWSYLSNWIKDLFFVRKDLKPSISVNVKFRAYCSVCTSSLLVHLSRFVSVCQTWSLKVAFYRSCGVSSRGCCSFNSSSDNQRHEQCLLGAVYILTVTVVIKLYIFVGSCASLKGDDMLLSSLYLIPIFLLFDLYCLCVLCGWLCVPLAVPTLRYIYSHTLHTAYMHIATETYVGSCSVDGIIHTPQIWVEARPILLVWI